MINSEIEFFVDHLDVVTWVQSHGVQDALKHVVLFVLGVVGGEIIAPEQEEKALSGGGIGQVVKDFLPGFAHLLVLPDEVYDYQVGPLQP